MAIVKICGSLISRRAYAVLQMQIQTLLKKNDRVGIMSLTDNRAYGMLTPELRKKMDDELEAAVYTIVGRLVNGEITPMMLSPRNKTRAAYIYYLRYLKYLQRDNPELARDLALKVDVDVQLNENIVNKHTFDDDYLIPLLLRRETSNEPEKTNYLFDKALHG